MHIVIRSIFNLRALRGAGRRRVTVLIDRVSGVEGIEYLRLLQPWRSWITIDAVVTLTEPPKPGVLKSQVSPTCQAVVVVSEREDIVRSVRRESESLGLTCIDSAYPSGPSRTLALCQEVAFHDFEIGGFNEWDEQPTKYSQHILKCLSVTHCEKIFPQWALPYIERLRQGQEGRPVEALDIGCGPISVLRWGVLRGLVSVTGVDPLLDMYHIILNRHGLSNLPEIFCQRELCISAEELSQYVPPGSYDFAFSRNAIDHVDDPPFLVAQVAVCLRPGGVFVLEFNTREGTHENWAQLHQFDLYLNSHRQLICQSRDGSIRSLVPEDTGFVLREIITNTDVYTVVVLERGQGSNNYEQVQRLTEEWKRKRLKAESNVTSKMRLYTRLRRMAKPSYRWAKQRGWLP